MRFLRYNGPSMKSVTILGIDPGTAIVGYGVVRQTGNKLTVIDFGCIKNPSTMPMVERLLRISQGITALLEKHAPD